MLARHLKSLLGVPGTYLGVVGWPSRPGERLFVRWDFWWQAHLLDCLVDAWLRQPNPFHARAIRSLVGSISIRNFGRFTTDYYDDMAWMGLALRRAEAAGVDEQVGIRQIVTAILDAWSPEIGAVPWRVGDDYYNAPANGPAAILLARNGFLDRARQLADWMDTALRPVGSALVADGFYAGHEAEPVYYSYVQGVVLGTEVELTRAGGDRSRVHRLVGAIDERLTTSGVLQGHGSGDGGLFTGILARYLALVGTDLPGAHADDRGARATATALVLRSAESAWANRASTAAGPLFGPDWTRPARLPGRGDLDLPERDLSVQLSGWMLLEAAALLARAG